MIHPPRHRLMIECNPAALSAVLEAARAAMPADTAALLADPSVTSRLAAKQRPLVPLLAVLLEAAEAVAKAIADNSWDDSAPLDSAVAESLSSRSYRLGADIATATQCKQPTGWSLPSFTGKELV